MMLVGPCDHRHLALCGVYSKDAIIETPMRRPAGILLLCTTRLLTSFYSWTLVFMTVWGPKALGRREHAMRPQPAAGRIRHVRRP